VFALTFSLWEKPALSSVEGVRMGIKIKLNPYFDSPHPTLSLRRGPIMVRAE